MERMMAATCNVHQKVILLSGKALAVSHLTVVRTRIEAAAGSQERGSRQNSRDSI